MAGLYSHIEHKEKKEKRTMVSYTSRSTGLTFRMTLRAAELVPELDYQHLPPPKGTIALERVPNPEALGFPVADHPLRKIYPSLSIEHHLLIVDETMMVERGGEHGRGGEKGLALYQDWNGSNLCATVASANGRNTVALWDWEGTPGSQTDPAATPPCLEWRLVSQQGGTRVWQNHTIHGWPGLDGKNIGYDWQDGVPTDLSTIHDRNRGRVRQFIWVPIIAKGLGIAEQTMAPEEVNNTFTVLLWFPRPEVLTHVPRLVNFWKGPQFDRRDEGTRSLGGLERSAIAKGAAAPQVEYKMAAGGLIPQHIIANPFGPEFWSLVPEVALVCWPVSLEQASRLLSTSSPSRRTPS